MPENSDGEHLQKNQNNDIPISDAMEAKKPQPSAQKKRSSTTRKGQPKRPPNAKRRKTSWWNKTSNTNKVLIFVGSGGVIVAAMAIWFNVQQHREEHRPTVIRP